MRIAVPHKLGREEVRRRIKAREHEIADFMPSMASVRTDWPNEDRLALNVQIMGKVIGGQIDIADHELVFEFDLPPALAFAEPIIRGTVEPQARKLLT